MIRKLLAPLRNYPRAITRSIIRGLFFGVFGIWMGYIMKIIIDSLSQGLGFSELRPYIVLIILLHIFKDAFGHFFRNLKWQLKNNVQSDLYEYYLQQYLFADPQITEQMGTGKANSILQRGCDQRVMLLDAIIYDFLSTTLPIVLGIIIIGSYFGIGGIVSSIIITTLLALSSKYGAERVNNYRKEKKELYTYGDRITVKAIMSKLEILQQQKTKEILGQIKKMFKEVGILLRKESGGMAWLFDSSRTFTSILRIFIVCYSIRAIQEGTMTVGTLALLWMVSGQLAQELFRLTEWITDRYQKMIHIQKLRDTFDTIKPFEGYEQGNDFQFQTGKISIQDISFAYNNNTEDNKHASHTLLFHDFSLQLPAQKKIALVGPSGGGKTTLIKLIMGYLRPQSGAIFIDGQSLSSVSLKSYFQHIGYLTQEPSVFDGTIRENLEYGITYDSKVSSLSKEGDHEVAEDLQTIIALSKSERIYDLPQGLDTEIGERGIRLSGGQKQRLAIAKIMLKNPNIILLDEPTSALDSANEAAVTEALNNLFQSKTVIIIAHRLQTVKHADDIIYIADGQVLERGTHQELLALGGEYYKMVELQSGF